MMPRVFQNGCKASLEEAFLVLTVEIKQTDSVGAGVGASMRWKSIQAIVVALLLCCSIFGGDFGHFLMQLVM